MTIEVRTITCIDAATFTKYGKWRVEIQVLNAPKRVCWLTDKQYDFLSKAASRLKRDQSTKQTQIIGLFDGEKLIRVGSQSYGKGDLDYFISEFKPAVIEVYEWEKRQRPDLTPVERDADNSLIDDAA